MRSSLTLKHEVTEWRHLPSALTVEGVIFITPGNKSLEMNTERKLNFSDHWGGDN